MKRRILILFIAFALILAGCGGAQSAGQLTPTPFPTPVRPTFTVKRGDISVEAKFGGRVAPLALQTAYFQIDGQVSEVYANVNDVVKKGQLLGELAQAKDLRAKAGETKRAIRRAQIKLEIAQLTLEEYKAQVPQIQQRIVSIMNRNRRPNASSFGQNCLAIVSSMIATGAALLAESCSSNLRPRKSGMPIVSRYPGVVGLKFANRRLCSSFGSRPSITTKFEVGPASPTSAMSRRG